MTGAAPEIRACAIGAFARRAVVPGATGEVIAVFARSFYLRLPGGLVCAGRGIGRGPLNLPCEGAVPADWRGRLAPGDGVVCGRAALCAGSVSIRVAGAEPGVPSADLYITPGSCCAGLAALARFLPRWLPEGGLAPLLSPRGGRPGPVARAGAEALAQLARWSLGSGDAAPPAAAVERLLGLGPGLTPSGDDALAGALYVIARLGETARRDALAAMIAAKAPERTNEISAAHLAAAGEGMLLASVERAIDAILSGDEAAVPPALAGLSSERHHSPWDAIAGAVAMMAALLPLLGLKEQVALDEDCACR